MDFSVRILFAFVEGAGHYNPLVPLARAAEAAGHTVAFACNPNRVGLPRADGFETHVAGIEPGTTPESDAFERRSAAMPPSREREDIVTREGFADAYARPTADDLLRLIAAWRPDVIVWDDVNLGAPVAAERAGIPHVAVQVIASGLLLRPAVIEAPLAAVRADHGLPPGETLTMLGRYLTLVPFPEGFRDPSLPLPGTARSIRPLLPDALPGEVAPECLAALPDDRPVVYYSLGTAFGAAALDVFRRTLPALAALPITLLVTVGRSLDPADLGPQPANVRVERYVSQALLLPRVDLVISHAGSGTVMGALSHGLPLALIPRGADQPDNAARCEALGVGRIIGRPESITGADAATAVTAMLADPAYRVAARTVQHRMAGAPGPDDAVAMIQRVVETRRPMTAS